MFKGESRFSDCAEVGAGILTKLTRWLWPVCAVGLILLGCRGPGPAATPMPVPSATPSPSVVPTQPPPTATVTPSVTVVRVDPTQGYQTMDGIGACTYTFPYANDLGWDWEAVKFVFDELDLAYLRLAPWLGWWETANDNEDPYTINWEGFGTVHANYIPAGARLVESASDDGRLLTLAFARPDGAYTLIVLNTAREGMTFRVTGVEGALRTAVTTTADHYEAVTSVTDGGEIIVPAESLTSLIIE